MINNLKRILDDRGMTQAELSKLIGMTEAGVSRLASGDRSGKIETWYNIIKILKIDWADMFPEFDEEDDD